MEIIVKFWDGGSVNGKPRDIFLQSYPFAGKTKTILIEVDGHVNEVMSLEAVKQKNEWNDFSDVEVLKMVENEIFVKSKKESLHQQIIEKDRQSDIFYVQIGEGNKAPKIDMWLNAQLRTQLLTNTFPAQLKAGRDVTALWTETKPSLKLPVPTQWGIENLPLVEEYAIQTLNARRENEYLVDTATTLEELEKINIESAYSNIQKVVLVLPIEQLPSDIQKYYSQIAQRLAK